MDGEDGIDTWVKASALKRRGRVGGVRSRGKSLEEGREVDR